jgi:hypothetical protein
MLGDIIDGALKSVLRDEAQHRHKNTGGIHAHTWWSHARFTSDNARH